MMKALLLLVLFALSFSGYSAGKIQKSLFTVHKVSVEGNKKVEAEAILEKIQITIGKKITSEELRNAIKVIYEMKYFQLVEAHHKVVKSKNHIIFKIKEKPIISKISFMGNDEVSDDDLKDEIKTTAYNILDVNSIKGDTITLRKFYEEKGFYLANVDYDLKKNEHGSLDLTFNVQESEKVRVKRIMFLGNHELQDEELKKFMATQEESYFSGISDSGAFKEFHFKTDIEKLKYLYKTKGFLQVNIGNPITTVSEDKKWIFITIKIKEGPKYDVNHVFFNGDLLFTEAEMRGNIKLISGEVYSEETLRKDIQVLTEMYQDKGYAFANVLRHIQIVPGENKVDIHYSFEKGKIAYFGKIIVKGNTKTRDKVIRRELRIHEGMMYSGSLLRKSKANVNRLGFFEPGTIIFNTVSPKGKDDILNVEISVVERQTGQISMGAGLSSSTGGFFQGSIAQNNFRGLGQNLNLNLQLAEKQETINLGFTEPYFMDSKWTAGGDIYRNRNATLAEFASLKYGADLRVGYPIFEYTKFFVTVRHEMTDISAVRNPSVDVDLENGQAATLKTTLRYDKRNNAFEPTNGHWGSASLEYAGFYGEQDWIKATLEGRYYKPVYKKLIFRSRMRVQKVTKTTSREIPRTDKFQLGGARNMRGYAVESIGPHENLIDTDTKELRAFNIGGNVSFLTQLELEHPLIEDAGLKWVLFYDAGNVYLDDLESDNLALRQDYGFGFRWFSPIGVLRFEFAFAIDPRDSTDEKNGDASNEFHFDIGNLF